MPMTQDQLFAMIDEMTRDSLGEPLSPYIRQTLEQPAYELTRITGQNDYFCRVFYWPREGAAEDAEKKGCVRLSIPLDDPRCMPQLILRWYDDRPVELDSQAGLDDEVWDAYAQMFGVRHHTTPDEALRYARHKLGNN